MYLGNSVSRAVKNVNEKISEALIGMDPTLQIQIDQAMIDLDKTDKKVASFQFFIYLILIYVCLKEILNHARQIHPHFFFWSLAISMTC